MSPLVAVPDHYIKEHRTISILTVSTFDGDMRSLKVDRLFPCMHIFSDA